MENVVKYLIRIASLPVVLAEGQRQHQVQRLEGYPDTFYVRTLTELPPTRPPLKRLLDHLHSSFAFTLSTP